MSIFSAFTPLAGGQLAGYYRDENYVLDLDGSLAFTRDSHSPNGPFPFPLTIGHIDGFVPQLNALEFSLMHGKNPTGPWVGAVPSNWQDAFGTGVFTGLSKVQG